MLQKNDRLIIFFSTILFIFFAFKFFTFNPSLVDETNKKLIAQVSEIESNVKRKIEGTILWSVLSSNANIYNGDQVFTDKGSSVQLKFKDDSSLVVPENSLVKIEERENDIQLDLKKGLVNIDFSNIKNKKVRVKLGDKRVELSSKNKGLVKVSNINNQVEFSSNDSEVVASEITEKGVSKSEKLIIKKGQKVIIPSKKGNWESELSSVGRRVDQRLSVSQSRKIERIIEQEFTSTKSTAQIEYKNQLKTLTSRAQSIDTSPKELVIDELKFISSRVPKSQRKPFQNAIKRIRTVRDLRPLKSSVENYVDSKFPNSPVLQEIAKVEVQRASKQKVYKNNAELLSSIGKSFDQLGVKKQISRPKMRNVNQISKVIGQEVNKEVSFDQINVIKKKTKKPQVIQEANESFVALYKKGEGESPLQRVAKQDKSFQVSLKKYEKERLINKKVIQKIRPVLTEKLSKEESNKVIKSIDAHSFSASNLSVDKDLEVILRPYQSKLSSNQTNWTKSLGRVSKSISVDKIDKKVSPNLTFEKEVNKGLLKKISTELMVSKSSKSYSELKKEVLKVNTRDFVKRPTSTIKKISKNLEAKNVQVPSVVSNNSWTKKLSIIGKQVEQRLVDDQISELTSYSPELKKIIVKDSQYLVHSPKVEVQKILSNKKKSTVLKDRAQVEEALVKTKALQVQKQELFEELTSELSLNELPKAKEIIKNELQKTEFSQGELSVQEKLITIGRVLDSKGIQTPKSVSSTPTPLKSFLGKSFKEKESVIVKPLPSVVEAGVDTKLLVGKTKGDTSEFKVEFSKTKDFKKVSYTKKINSKVAKLNFSKTGDYYYRVSKTVDNVEAKTFDILHTDAPKEFSPVKKISIKAPAAPVTQVVPKGTVSPEVFSSLPIKWSGAKNETYELEVSQKSVKPNTKPIVKTFKVKGPKANLDLTSFNVHVDNKNKILKANDISYRVRKVGRVESAWSDKKSTSIAVKSFVAPVMEQENKVYVKRRFKKKATLPFEWKSSLPNEAHVLTVAKDKDFKKVIVQKTVKGNKAKVTTSYEGAIFWKVAPKVFPKNAKVPVSKKTVLSSTIRIDKKVVKKNIPVSENSPVTQVKLGWRYTRPTATKEKQIEVSRDPEFKKVIASKTVPTEQKKAQFELKEKGKYYWRVKDVGAKSSNISGVNSFNIVENVKVPVPSVKSKQIIKYKIVNDLPAYEIQLPSLKNASFVELEIYSDEELTKLVLRKKFKSKKALWVTNRSGKFFYRVRTVSKTGRKSKFSEPGKLIFPISPLIRSDLE